MQDYDCLNICIEEQPKNYRAEIWTRKVPVTSLAHFIAHYGVITKM